MRITYFFLRITKLCLLRILQQNLESVCLLLFVVQLPILWNKTTLARKLCSSEISTSKKSRFFMLYQELYNSTFYVLNYSCEVTLEFFLINILLLSYMDFNKFVSIVQRNSSFVYNLHTLIVLLHIILTLKQLSNMLWTRSSSFFALL